LNIEDVKTMKKALLIAVAAIMTAMSMNAQKIQVVDNNGHGIPFVHILTEDGNIIGNTNIDGVLDDVKGAEKVLATHVAYKPQAVRVSSLNNGRITLEDVDYDIEEIVVKPKPYIYVETYYRVYAFINDSLRFYQAGIFPNAIDLKNKKKEKGSQHNCMGDFYPATGVGITWGARVMEFNAGEIRLTANAIDKIKDIYHLTVKDEAPGRQSFHTATEKIGTLVRTGGQSIITIDAGKAQMYRNEVEGKSKLLEKRKEKHYDYQYTETYNCDEEGNSNVEDFVMYSHQWQWDGGKGRYKFIIETYGIDRDYMDKNEWKDKKKELKKEYKSHMSLDLLESIATSHNIPALAPSLRSAIEGWNKKK
jgi:hypothetical protein